jgi:hypothetical protein
MALARPRGMAGFTVIWSGQFVSMLGSSMTGFALSLWAWEATRRSSVDMPRCHSPGGNA